MSTLASNNPYSNSTRAENTGVSSIAAKLAANYGASDSSTSPSLVRGSVFDRLAAVFEECHQPGWNGSFAKPVSGKTFENAWRFLTALPSTIPVPDVTVEPDGEIAFEWRASDRSAFSVSVGSGDIVAFAGLFGYGEKQHGTEPFDDTIPPVVIGAIRRVFQRTSPRPAPPYRAP